MMGSSPMSQSVEMSAAAVLFDLDGVLVFSSASVHRSWTAWAHSHGIDPVAVLAAASGTRSVDTIRQVAPHLDAEAEATRLEAGQALDTSDVTAGPGAAALLESLAQHEWAIVTSGSEPLARARLRAAGLPEPKVFVTAEQVSAGKPDPAGYLLAAGLLGAPPQRCVVIEDAAAGIAAGRSAGMRVIGLGGGESEHLAEADVVAGACADLEVLREPGRGLIIRTTEGDV
ncbi:sugar-phosphatase [Lentzea jiangxiensis]|uniref:Sugar-phosphatase n=2 Tax=Lentzea jiangxiensis TaxID=641025 RepID=A0A1H0SER7_9PSEU|nr:sugar-phosphatase [Lentzea jiangxiensis]